MVQGVFRSHGVFFLPSLSLDKHHLQFTYVGQAYLSSEWFCVHEFPNASRMNSLWPVERAERIRIYLN